MRATILKDAFALVYVTGTALSRRATQEFQYRIARWGRFGGPSAIREISAESIASVRAAMSKSGLSADTIESTIDSVLQILRVCHRAGMLESVPHVGRRLKLSRSIRYVPPLEDLGALYAAAAAARWPVFCDPGPFWRGVLVLAYWAGLRHQDLFWSLRWAGISKHSIVVTANKTGKTHVFPRCSVVDRHLAALARVSGDDRLFPIGVCRKQILRELHRMADVAGVEPFQLHAVRRLACTEWQAARWGAGEVLQGKSLGVCDRYIVPRLLQQAAPALKWPDQMLTAAERDQATVEETRLLGVVKRLGSTERTAVLALAERLAN